MTVAARRLWLNEDSTAIVEEGADDARFLLAGKGCEIPAGFDALLAELDPPADVPAADDVDDEEEPAEPAEPAEPTEPAEPAEPTEPTEPAATRKPRRS